MVKECKVILNNSAVSVILFDGKEVQIPSIKSDKDTVFVEFNNGKYRIVDEPQNDTAPVSMPVATPEIQSEKQPEIQSEDAQTQEQSQPM